MGPEPQFWIDLFFLYINNIFTNGANKTHDHWKFNGQIFSKYFSVLINEDWGSDINYCSFRSTLHITRKNEIVKESFCSVHLEEIHSILFIFHLYYISFIIISFVVNQTAEFLWFWKQTTQLISMLSSDLSNFII